MKQTIPKCQVIGCVQFAVEKIKVWYIEASTGCTCCRDQKLYHKGDRKVKK